MGAAAPFALAVTVASVVAGLLMILAEFLTVVSVDVASGSCEEIRHSDPELADRCSLSGFERHGGAVVLIGVLTLLMAWGAGMGGSRPAGAALVVAGAMVLGIALLADLPVTDETGAIGRNFEGASAQPGSGLYLALVAGALAVAVGLARLLRDPG